MRDVKMSVRGMLIMLLVLANAIILRNGFAVGAQWYWGLLITVPLLVIVIVDIIQKERAIMNTDQKFRTGLLSFKRKCVSQ